MALRSLTNDSISGLFVTPFIWFFVDCFKAEVQIKWKPCFYIQTDEGSAACAVTVIIGIKHLGEEKGRKTFKYSMHKGICTSVSGLGAANECSHEAAHWVETGIINKAKGKVYHSFWQVACMMGFSGAKCTPLLHICVLQFPVPMHFEVASKRKITFVIWP